jgi:hypothetical protein
MDIHALEYFQQYSGKSEKGHFHHVISLQNHPNKSWSDLSKMAPTLSRGWFELSHLPTVDRIEFTREFWLSKLPYHPKLSQGLSQFFSSLDDIGVFLTQKTYDDTFQPHLVYSLAHNGGFFQGHVPANEEKINVLKKAFPSTLFPNDYLAFLQIHNGFCKCFDTGLMAVEQMANSYQQFQKMLDAKEPVITTQGRIVNIKSLMPFYESFGMPFFQCFWEEWYTGQEMGNVYYSGEANTISDYAGVVDGSETMAFETFTDWLLFYLEKVSE